MRKDGEIKDILILGFLKDGLARRNNDLIKQQQEVAKTLLARRNDIIARKRAYRVFILLEKAISSDYRTPMVIYQQSMHWGKTYLEENAADLEFGRKYPRLSRRVFSYLKSRVEIGRQRV